MLKLHNLTPLKKKRKRVGRGGSRGGTSGRGHKGQLARSGGGLREYFEGGQMPLSRRLPRRGFTNVFKTEYKIISLQDLEKRFETGATVSANTLREKGFIKGRKCLPIKILSMGGFNRSVELTKKFAIHADAWSKSAEDAIKKAGGTIQKVAIVKEIEGGITS